MPVSFSPFHALSNPPRFGAKRKAETAVEGKSVKKAKHDSEDKYLDSANNYLRLDTTGRADHSVSDTVQLRHFFKNLNKTNAASGCPTNFVVNDNPQQVINF